MALRCNYVSFLEKLIVMTMHIHWYNYNRPQYTNIPTILKDTLLFKVMPRCTISFYGHMEYELHLEECKTFEDVEKEVNEYINYYNYYKCF